MKELMAESPEEPGEGRRKLKQELDTPGKIMVSGIPKNKDYTEVELEKEFAPFGRITEVNIIRDRRSSIPRGFAFVTYENPQDSVDAIKAMEGKDLGGEAAVHCEQAVLGVRRKLATEESRGGPRGGRGGRFLERGGRGPILEHGRGRGDRGRRIMNRSRGLLDGGMRSRDNHFDKDPAYEEEEYYDVEPDYRGYPSSGHGGPSQRRRPPPRGGPPPLLSGGGRSLSRGASSGLIVPVRGGPNRRVLLPSPPARGNMRIPYRGHPREEYYEEDAEGDYYSGQGDEVYPEEYEEPYPEEADYPAEDYYRRRPTPLVSRGAVLSRGRGGPTKIRPGADRTLKEVDEYGYTEEGPSVSHRSNRVSAPIPRRNVPVPLYNEEAFEEENPRHAAAPKEPYGGGRVRGPQALLSSGLTRPVRMAPPSRGTAPVRRAALLGSDPYSSEESPMYDGRAPQQPLRSSASAYDDDPYADQYIRRNAPAAVPRQQPAVRFRPGLLPTEDRYAPERAPPKSLLSVDLLLARRPGSLSAPTRHADDYESANPTRDSYAETRRPVVRREAEYRPREDLYQRAAAEMDAYVSYPPNLRGASEQVTNEQYSRKRLIDQYDDVTEVPRNLGAALRRDYDGFRSSSGAVPIKRERLEKGAGRGAYEMYSSRQEGAYRLL